MTTRLPVQPTETWDCLHCGATYWYKGANPPPCACGDALVRRLDPKFKPDFYLLWHDAPPELEHIEDRLLGGWHR